MEKEGLCHFDICQKRWSGLNLSCLVDKQGQPAKRQIMIGPAPAAQKLKIEEICLASSDFLCTLKKKTFFCTFVNLFFTCVKSESDLTAKVESCESSPVLHVHIRPRLQHAISMEIYFKTLNKYLHERIRNINSIKSFKTFNKYVWSPDRGRRE